jgi:homogentisate phytyltransferase/homogentisate geranylgeranyltransferase
MSRTSYKSSNQSSNLVQRHVPWLYAFWKFSRPHTVIGTSLSVFGLYLIVLASNHQLLLHPIMLIAPLIACLCGNVYIVGLNQLEDIEIDRINKPNLPLASGEFSVRQGRLLVILTGIIAIAVAASQSPYLFGMVGLSLAIGTLYSLPPVRLKRFPFWASLCIFTVRGMIVNLGLFLHFNQGFPIPAKVWALTIFILVFTFAIAIFKDMPDTEGDRRYNIRTLTLRLGQRPVFNLACAVLTSCYLSIIAIAPFLPGVNAPFLIVGHLIALATLWFRSYKIDLQDKVEVTRFYQVIWKLFFLEYLIFPAGCFLG